jgi:hypothetical protein
VGDCTYVVKILLRKIDAGGPPLDASTVDKDMDLAAHEGERSIEEAPNGFEVGEICLEVVDAGSSGLAHIGGGRVRVSGSYDENDGGRTCLGESECTRGADAWLDGRC